MAVIPFFVPQCLVNSISLSPNGIGALQINGLKNEVFHFVKVIHCKKDVGRMEDGL